MEFECSGLAWLGGSADGLGQPRSMSLIPSWTQWGSHCILLQGRWRCRRQLETCNAPRPIKSLSQKSLLHLPTFIGQNKSCIQPQSKGQENVLYPRCSEFRQHEEFGPVIQLTTDGNGLFFFFFECLLVA